MNRYERAAHQFLTEVLGDGPVPVETIVAQAAGRDVDASALVNAAVVLGAETFRALEGGRVRSTSPLLWHRGPVPAGFARVSSRPRLR